ncbi:copper amine oxidase domain protein [Desulfofarcimen acetoxidans DSM 771]|uniref:Copper amine oxidase domain protein n=1 Tax=Desulfofarcimen acetoxidans (strain ATCC 49208 / DSM 771 / KCTC 5769 / VKM B-1644 / 5575) TaxID=485916 RepID=C8VWN5_DESAS|nr:copper amine oxidase N-terminal domain-containing protein [Desulfofarcimen acetoxidans]ACV64399.1 copper amine oxidase domain protein [Desulfofarcimen acetoxidans DSM 771]
MKLKRGIVFFLMLGLLLMLPVPAMATPKVILDGNQLSFDVSPTIENDRTLVPLRTIFEALGADVNWNGTTQTVTATKDNVEVKLQIGVKTAYKNGSPVTLDVPAKIMNDRTVVPLRFVSEAFGSNVAWDASTQTITITSITAVPAVTGQIKVTPQSQSQQELSVTQGQFVGSTESNKYHSPDCRYVEKIAPENKIWFKDAVDAEAHEYVPCGVCKP